MNAPLAGVLVVSIEQAVAAPYCTARLADAGARVIKVERIGGDFARLYDTAAEGRSVWFMYLNRGKESLEVDFKRPEDAALLHRILARADVFVQNLAPGAAERAGFGAGALRRAHPRLITCDLNGYGDAEGYRDMRAYDLLVQAESGIASVTGGPEGPGRVGVSIADLGTGANAHAAILQALYQRERIGEGSALAVSMFDSMADWMSAPLLLYERTGYQTPRTGMRHPLVAPYGAYDTADGVPLMIAVQNDREWVRFAEGVLERPELAAHADYATNVLRVEHREAMEREIGAVFGRVPRAELEARLRRHQIAYGAINTLRELATHGALRRVPVDTEVGPLQMVASPIRVQGLNHRVGPVPMLGVHTERIRAEFAA
jgi:crotonobetainyl-CoA:carnitine CoA-transferase CaiB-like acyl-CoA transferase